MMKPFANDWDILLRDEINRQYFKDIMAFLNAEYRKTACYPPPEMVFNALRSTACADIKAVILGQDPYHNPGQAHGLCFSVNEGVEKPASLNNIFEELSKDIGCSVPQSGCLTKWAQQGVLLLNTILSVRKNEPMSHANCGWQTFTDRVISIVNQKSEPVVFLLWGSPARAKKQLITAPQHLVLEAPHPSPLSAYRGFFGCRHFSKTNNFLVKNGRAPIDWAL